MSTRQKREQQKVRARTLYLKEKKSPEQIAEILGLHMTTIYRWKREDNWEKDLTEMLNTGESLREQLFQQLNKKVEELAREGGSPDGIAKLWKVIKELDPTVDKLGNTIRTMEELTSFLGEHYPAMLKEMAEPIERFLDYVRDQYD